MRLLVSGDRHWTNKDVIKAAIQYLLKDNKIECVIEGECKGADIIAREVAEGLGLTVIKFPADWTRFGNGAGNIRNQQMIDEGSPDFVLAFHNDIANSKGTKDMLKRAMKNKIPYMLITEQGNMHYVIKNKENCK